MTMLRRPSQITNGHFSRRQQDLIESGFSRPRLEILPKAFAVSVYVPPVVAKCRELYSQAAIAEFETTTDLIAAHAEILHVAHGARNDAAVQQINNWHPELIGKPADVVFEYDFKLDDARWALSRECGYQNWDDALAKAKPIDVAFENAVDLALAGDLSGLDAALSDRPDLLQQTSSFGHQATILIYMGSNGVEFWRQVVPENICDVVKLLAKMGADPSATANVYGGQLDVLALADSSAHPAAAGVAEELVSLLKSIVQSKP